MEIRGISYGEFGIYVTDGVYLHGQLEKENGFDLCVISECPNGRYDWKEDGIYPCTVTLSNGNQYDATLYLWQKKASLYTKTCGLVVRKGDTEAEENAREKYEKRTPYI